MSRKTTPQPVPNRLVNEKYVAEMTGIPVRSLQQQRFLGRGMPYIKLGKAVRYDLQDVMEYLEACKVRPDETCAK